MTEFEILRDFGYVVLAAAGCVLLARPLRLPPIMAYIVAGLVLGPLLRLAGHSEPLEMFSEIGIALLLFLVGLELDREAIRSAGRTSLVSSLIKVMVSTALAFAVCRLFGLEAAPAALLALAVAFSSTLVVVKLLDQRGELRAPHGRLAVGILIVEDLLVVIAITALAGLEARGTAGAEDVAGSVLRAFAGMAVLGGIAFLAARGARPGRYCWLARSTEAVFILSLAWCFLFIVAAEQLGLSLEIGAFLAGVSLAQLPFTETLRRRVQPLVNLFTALFFVTLGVSMQLDAAADYWGIALVLSLLVLLGRPFLLFVLLVLQRQSTGTAFMTAIALGQISEFSFIVAALGVDAGILEPSIFSLVAVVGLVTIGVSSYLITHGDAVYAAARRSGLLRGLRTPVAEPKLPSPPSGHIVVVGMNSLGRRIVDELTMRGHEIVAIDTDASKLEGLAARTVTGAADDDGILEEASLARARMLISALQIQETNLFLAYRCRELGVPASIHASDPIIISELRGIGVEHLMISKHDGVRQIAAELRRAGLLR